MNKEATKTDNSFFDAKVNLRYDNLPDQKHISVLDCFSGDGLIWSAVQARATGKTISVLPIDTKATTAQVHLIGDNMKFIGAMDLTGFDVIDLDAYGSAIAQLRLLLTRELRVGVVLHITFIQSIFGRLPDQFLMDLGYSKAMIKKIPSLFYKDGQAKLLEWLSLHGFKRVAFWSDTAKRKTYLCTKKQ